MQDESGEDETIDTRELFEEFSIEKLNEMKLAADRPIGEHEGFQILLKPMEIRTFIARVSWKDE